MINLRPSLKYAGPVLLLLPVVVLTIAFALLVHLQTKRTTDALSSEIVKGIAVGLDRQVRADLQTSVGVADHLASLVKGGVLSTDQLKPWRTTLLRHLDSFKNINSVMIGNTKGLATWVIRYPDEKLPEYAISSNSNNGTLKVTEYRLGKNGAVGKKLGHYAYDARDRPWYQAGIKAGHPTWSNVYPWVRRNGDISALGIARSQPVYSSDGQLLGVVGIDVGLAEVSQFMRDGQIPAGGIAYLTSSDGALVASSTHMPLIGPDDSRVQAKDASFALIARVADTQQGRGDINSQGEILFQGSAYVVRSIPLHTPWHLGWTLTLAVPKAQLTANAQMLRQRTWLAGGILALLMMGFGIMLSRSFIRPIGRLTKAVNQIGQGQLDTQVDIRGWKEFRLLSTQVNKMSHDLRDRARLRHSLDVAMEVQQQLLPATVPQAPGLDIASQSTYCDQTGGDYFDFLEVGRAPSDGLFVVLGDVMGHGISAALLMATARGFLRSGAPNSKSLGHLLSHVNNLLVADTGGERFMTMLVLVANGQDKMIHWASAGQDPAIIYSAKEDKFLELDSASGLPLGIMEDEIYPDVTQTALSAGDILLVSTDGLWETHNAQKQQFGKDRVRAIMQAQRVSSAEEIAAALTKGLNQFRGSINAQDDVTFVVVKFNEDGKVDRAKGA